MSSIADMRGDAVGGRPLSSGIDRLTRGGGYTRVTISHVVLSLQKAIYRGYHFRLFATLPRNAAQGPALDPDPHRRRPRDSGGAAGAQSHRLRSLLPHGGAAGDRRPLRPAARRLPRRLQL